MEYGGQFTIPQLLENNLRKNNYFPKKREMISHVFHLACKKLENKLNWKRWKWLGHSLSWASATSSLLLLLSLPVSCLLKTAHSTSYHLCCIGVRYSNCSFLQLFIFLQYAFNFVIYAGCSQRYRSAFSRYLRIKVPCLFTSSGDDFRVVKQWS